MENWEVLRAIFGITFVAVTVTTNGAAMAQPQDSVDPSVAQPRGGNTFVVDCTGENGAFSTIQAAVDAAASGDEIVIMPNDCDPDGCWFEAVEILGKALTLRSSNPEDESVVNATILKHHFSHGWNSILKLRPGATTPPVPETLPILIDGLTIQEMSGGNGAIDIDAAGGNVSIRRCAFWDNTGTGAVRVVAAGDVHVDGCRFYFNGFSSSVDAAGAAIMCGSNDDNLITNCYFSDNIGPVVKILEPFVPDPTVDFYGRIQSCQFVNNNGYPVVGDSIEIDDCTITGNSGGGLSADRLRIVNSEFVANAGTAPLVETFESLTMQQTGIVQSVQSPGATIFCHDSTVMIQNCEISGHGREYLIRLDDSQGVVADCVFQNNRTVVYGVLSGPLAIERCQFLGNSRAAVHITNGSGLSITDSDFIDHNSPGSGPAVQVAGGTIERCLFSGNSASFDGGAVYSFPSLTVRESQFFNNRAARLGGAIFTSLSSTFTDCLFVGNSSDRFGALICTGGGTVSGCTFVGNRDVTSSAVVSTRTLGNSIVVSNRNINSPSNDNAIYAVNVSHSVIDGSVFNLAAGGALYYAGTIIDDDPRFVNPGFWNDMETPEDLTDDVFVPGDYHLLPESPCIDGGDPAFIPGVGASDLDGEPRVQGCRVDMGVDEFTQGEILIGDVNADGVVTLDDLVSFVAKLIAPRGLGACAADVNGDGRTDGLDIEGMIALVLGG